MNEQLAEALAEIDDPEIIRKIITADGVEAVGLNEQPNCRTNLNELFDRFFNRREDRSPATRSQYKRTIPHFIEFAGEREIEYPSGISTRLVDQYVDSLQDAYDADATVHTYTKNTRMWLQWLSKRNLCDDSVYHLLDKNEIGLSPRARDEALRKNEATSVLEALRKKRQGSETHALTELFWNGGPRIGGAHSADLCDFDPQNHELRLRHRPELGTRLKNGCEEDTTPGDSERNIELSDSAINAVKSYIRTTRPDVTDEYGREPLFATQYGRASKSTLRRWVYRATSCRWLSAEDDGKSCNKKCCPDSNVCELSYYPHAIRRGSIVSHLSGGLRLDIASERFDVSMKIIKKHYDPRTKRQQKEDRSESVRDAW